MCLSKNFYLHINVRQKLNGLITIDNSLFGLNVRIFTSLLVEEFKIDLTFIDCCILLVG